MNRNSISLHFIREFSTAVLIEDTDKQGTEKEPSSHSGQVDFAACK